MSGHYQLCENCDEVESTHCCADCGVLLCEECGTLHPKVKATRGHNIAPRVVEIDCSSSVPHFTTVNNHEERERWNSSNSATNVRVMDIVHTAPTAELCSEKELEDFLDHAFFHKIYSLILEVPKLLNITKPGMSNQKKSCMHLISISSIITYQTKQRLTLGQS